MGIPLKSLLNRKESVSCNEVTEIRENGDFSNFFMDSKLLSGFHLGTLHAYFIHSDFWLKLIEWTKIAFLFLRVTSKLFQFTILYGWVVPHPYVKKFFKTIY